MCVGESLNIVSCSKFWGNLEGIWGNPGEIPQFGWKIPGVYRDKVNSSRIIENDYKKVWHVFELTTHLSF